MYKLQKMSVSVGRVHLKSALISLFAAGALTAMADERETLGLWTFNGESGTYACANKEEYVFSNHVERADSLRLQLEWAANADAATEAPLYTNDVQYAYLFDGVACANFIAECGTSAIFRYKNWKTSNGYGAANSFLTLLEAGALIKDRDWTLEMIAHFPRTGGWSPFVNLATNIGNKAAFDLRTNGQGMVNDYYYYDGDVYANKQVVVNVSYTSYDEGAGGTLPHSIYLSDGRWHHVALKWSESEKTLRMYIDYVAFASGTRTYWKDKGVNLRLDDHARFKLFAASSGVYNSMPTIQAVRLTRGELPVKDFLCTSRFRNRPDDTVAHWRFNGEPGEIVQIVSESSQPNRSDLRLWKALTNDYTLAFIDPWRAIVKQGGEFVKNTSALGWSGRTASKSSAATGAPTGATNPFDDPRAFITVNRKNPVFTAAGMGDSFTHEMFVLCQTNNLYRLGNATDMTPFFGEFGSSDGFEYYGKNNWYVSQARTGDGDKARIQLTYQYTNEVAGTAAVRVNQYVPITTNEWHHLALTYDGPTRKLNFYVDYKPAYEATLAEGARLTRGTGVWGLGDPCMGQWMGIVGAIDDWRISRRALAPSEFLKQTIGPGFSIFIR